MTTLEELPAVAVSRPPPAARRPWRRWRSRFVRLAATRAVGLAWQLHVLVDVAVELPTGNRREARELLAAGGFATAVMPDRVTRVELSLRDAVVMRPKPCDGDIWRWTVAYDTHVPVTATQTVGADPPVAVGWWGSPPPGRIGQPHVTVIACVATVTDQWPFQTAGNRSARRPRWSPHTART
jgi:hypothetical protein